MLSEEDDELLLSSVSISVRTFFVRLRRESRFALPVFLGGTAIAAVLISLQNTIPPTLGFFAMIAGGVAIGLVRRRDALATGFFLGYLSFFAGTVAVFVGYAIGPGTDPVWLVILAGVVIGAIFGVLTGLWSAGGAALGAVLRRRVFARAAR